MGSLWGQVMGFQKPAEILYDLHHGVQFIDKLKAPHTKLGPGQVVLGLSAEVREKLKNLKSSDIANLRIDALLLPEERK